MDTVKITFMVPRDVYEDKTREAREITGGNVDVEDVIKDKMEEYFGAGNVKII